MRYKNNPLFSFCDQLPQPFSPKFLLQKRIEKGMYWKWDQLHEYTFEIIKPLMNTTPYCNQQREPEI